MIHATATASGGTDWTTTVAAVAAAAAALIALANVLLSLWRDRQNRQAHLIFQVGISEQLSPGVDKHFMSITNVGLGPAIGPQVLGVIEGMAFGLDLASALLAAGTAVDMPIGHGALVEVPPAVVIWQNVDGRFSWTTSRSRSVRSARIGRWPRKFQDWPLTADLFRREVPDVTLPPPQVDGTGAQTGAQEG